MHFSFKAKRDAIVRRNKNGLEWLNSNSKKLDNQSFFKSQVKKSTLSPKMVEYFRHYLIEKI